jgi:PAS domain S-box-containing protein
VSASPTDSKLPREMFCALIENVEDYAIFAMDLQGIVVHCNLGTVRMTGFEASELIGKPLDQIFTPEDVQAGAPQIELRAAASLGRAANERWHVRKDRSRFWSLGTVVPLRRDDGVMVGFGKFMRDRTDLKQMHENLQSQNEALKRADGNKDRFLATLAHELRNPLFVMTTTAYVLRNTARGAEEQKIVERLQRQIVHTQRLVDDLADLSRARRAAIHIAPRPLDLRISAREAVDAILSSMTLVDHRIDVFLTETPVEINGDPVRIHQIMVNLLTNAVRYTPPGGAIGLRISEEGREAVIRVKDTGVGIPPDKLANIFELFTQVHEHLAESQAGLGLGLSLTRELVALHGGTIQAASEGAGKGSEFIVRLPLRDGAGRSHAGPAG